MYMKWFMHVHVAGDYRGKTLSVIEEGNVQKSRRIGAANGGHLPGAQSINTATLLISPAPARPPSWLPLIMLTNKSHYITQLL